MFTSTFDTIIAIILMFLSFVGLIRGFLKEVSSIANWFGSFYLTSVIKPFISPFFEDKIKIPFLMDMVVNVLVFVGLMIVISIITNYLTVILKKLIPSSLNGSLGFIFGLLKGILLSLLIIAFLKIAYNKKTPDYLENSIIYTAVSSDDIFVRMLSNIFGDFAKEKESIDDLLNEIDETSKKELDEKIDDISKNIGEKIYNTHKNIENSMENMGDKIDDTTKTIDDVINEVSDKKDEFLDQKNLNRLIDIINE